MQLNHDKLAKHPCTLRRRWGAMLGRLSKTTHFNMEELESLCFVFHKLTRGSRGRMSRKDFIEIMHSALDMTNTGNADYSYKNFDPNNNSFIGMEDWVRGMSVVLRGTLEEKVTHCFETYDRYAEKCLKRKNLIWMVTENWKATPDADSQGLVEELLETIVSSIASDTEKGITLEDYEKAVKKYPMLLQFLGEVLPSRPANTTFLATMMPDAKAYAYCPEYRTERPKEPKPFLAHGESASQVVVERLGGVHNKGPRAAND
ncbi:EF-hand calcium-binding domain-containing protein 1-like [Thrips palmi]|uniref:EF-hand calcium-binding domain-containing protein 1-like n=1 Tax=Thrips palmi TaxID=161013 RepID=A0A6P9A6K0_THRPL|nr:EF-hand calcium-binding domain-containing protein 1-like [Thrips palmi]XP_034253537.1 EF-hand calcium-binding domain-containing protein 1-like [Thrips palmi]